MRRSFVLCLLAFGVMAGVSSNVLGQTPGFASIDYPGSTGTQAWGINSRGDIIGLYTSADKATHGFLLSGGHYTPIDYPGAAVTLVNGIGPRGEMVGEVGTTLTSAHRGFLLSTNGIFTPLDFPGATVTAAIGINARGDIVGIFNFADNVSHGFLLTGDHYTQFDYPAAAATVPNGINAQGDIVGGMAIGGVNHGFLFRNGKYTSFDPTGSAFTTATGVNASGDIVGRFRDAAGVNHGFMLSAGKYTTIDVPNATYTGATSIDPIGNILGRDTIGGVNHGFLMTRQQAPTQRYTITDLGPIGGPPAQPYAITNGGLIGGTSIGTDGAMHAVAYYKGQKSDLSSPGLGGMNSIGFSMNERGQVVGAAESSTPDSSGEDFCGFKADALPYNGSKCLPFVGQYGVMTPLPTLGGNNGQASWINNRGEIVGAAENTKVDPACASPQQFQFKPVIWEHGQVQELPTFGTDKNGYAFVINDNGQTVGASGDCGALQVNGTYLQARHALLWETGRVTDLGNLGGTGLGTGIIALNINNQAQVVGTSDLPGDKTYHGFVWSRETGMVDIGTLPGDVDSVALAVNDGGEVIGISFDKDFNLRAFIRQQGALVDLNTLVPADSMFLALACAINARGEIAGWGVTDDGDVHAFLATPAEGAAPQRALTRKRPALHLNRRP